MSGCRCPCPISQRRHKSRTSTSPWLTIAKAVTLTATAILAFLTNAGTTSAATSTLSPNPVGGFAICQTPSSLHIQGGVGYSYSATYLQPTNQHFRLDLSASFDSTTTFPTWANLTSDWSPFQRFHTGVCTTDQATFLTVGNADVAAGGPFMSAYSVSSGKWTSVSQAVSVSTSGNGNGNGNGRGKGSNNNNNGAAGRTMASILLSSSSSSPSPVGVVLGGGWIPQDASSPRSVQATGLTNLVTEADLIGFSSKDESVDSLTWTQAPLSGNGGNNLNQNIGPSAGTRLVNLANGKALVLGGVTKGSGGGIPFANLAILDMNSGAVTMQKAQAAPQASIPAPRYGHCVVLSTDGNTVYMFGGSLVNDDKPTNDLFALNLQTWTWSQPTLRSSVTATPPPVRDHQCIMVGDQLLSLFGFNANQAPASSGPLTAPGSSLPAIPPAPLIYVLSISQLTWSTRFNALPNTPAPPPVPDAPTGGKGKVSAAGVAFGVIFGLAIIGVIAFMVISNRRKKARKLDTLLLIELQNREREQEKRERQQEREREQKYLPPVPNEAHFANNNHHQGHQQQYQGEEEYDLNNAPYYQAPRDPFENQGYMRHQHQHGQHMYDQPYQQHQQYPPPPPPQQQRNPFEANAYYAQRQQHQQELDSSAVGYVPEEMGHVSPTMSHGGSEANAKVPLHLEHGGSSASPNDSNSSGRRIPGGRGDKMSFVDTSSSYR